MSFVKDGVLKMFTNNVGSQVGTYLYFLVNNRQLKIVFKQYKHEFSQ